MSCTRTDRIIRTCLLSVMLLFGLTGCGGDEKAVDPEAGKLLVIGIDSADWRLLKPMLDEGRLPHLRTFMEQSSHGRMKTFFPLEKSPLLWASILTGVRPEIHGVNNFVKGSGQKPVTGSAWFAPALWDMIGAAGKSTAPNGAKQFSTNTKAYAAFATATGNSSTATMTTTTTNSTI